MAGRGRGRLQLPKPEDYAESPPTQSLVDVAEPVPEPEGDLGQGVAVGTISMARGLGRGRGFLQAQSQEVDTQLQQDEPVPFLNIGRGRGAPLLPQPIARAEVFSSGLELLSLSQEPPGATIGPLQFSIGRGRGRGLRDSIELPHAGSVVPPAELLQTGSRLVPPADLLQTGSRLVPPADLLQTGSRLVPPAELPQTNSVVLPAELPQTGSLVPPATISPEEQVALSSSDGAVEVGQPAKEQAQRPAGKISSEEYTDVSQVHPVAVPVAASEAEVDTPVLAVPPVVREQIIATKSRRGEKGAKVHLATNFLRMTIQQSKGIFEYHVTFEPEFDSIPICKKVVYNMKEEFGPVRSFDGAKLTVPNRLESDILCFETAHPNLVESKVIVRVEFVKQVALSDAIHFYNILLRRMMEMTKLKQINRNYYDAENVHHLPQHKLEIWSGYDTAIDNYEGGLMVCVETSHRVLRKTTLLENMKQLQISNKQDWKVKFQEVVHGKSVLTRYNNTFYKIDDVDWENNPTCSFMLRSGGPTTFIDYYKNHHGETIKDKTQPLLISRVKPKKNDPTGESKAILLVPELTFVTGLSEDITSNFNTMKDLIERTRITPMQRLKHIKDFIERIKKCEEASQLLGSWGLVLEDADVVKLEGRLVPHPSIKFNDRVTKLAPNDNDFSRQTTSGACYRPVDLKRWIVFVPPQDQDKANKLVDCYKQVAPQLGIRFTPPEIVIIRGAGRYLNGNDYRMAIKEKAIQDEVQFVVIILSQQRDELYSASKRQCLVESSIPSQVVLAKTLSNEKRLRSIMQKIVLQINCKLGGALWALQIPLKEQIMFVGIDSYHDPKRKNKSVLAIVSSMDTECTSYYSKVRYQAAHAEIADTLRGLFEGTLAAYYERSHFYPDRIVVFRDGVGDGQLKYVVEHEIPQLRTAISKICPGMEKFSLIVTQKRINERIFKTSGPQQMERLENPDPGTVVDHIITRSATYDFFLISQTVRQGTVGPTHYVVLDDSGESKPDLVQRFAFALTYMYFNWPGTIRGPAVCQYAHKLAYLVGQHLGGEQPKSGMDSQLYYL